MGHGLHDPEDVAVNVLGGSRRIPANVEITNPNASGVIFAHESRFGGHTLFIKNRKLHYVYNFVGIAPGQVFESPSVLPGRPRIGEGSRCGTRN